MCTGEVWMMELRLAVSQWKRARGGSRPIGAAASPPRQIAGMDAARIEEGPVVSWAADFALPAGFHGAWVG